MLGNFGKQTRLAITTLFDKLKGHLLRRNTNDTASTIGKHCGQGRTNQSSTKQRVIDKGNRQTVILGFYNVANMGYRQSKPRQ
jgi:hypothetical protein